MNAGGLFIDSGSSQCCHHGEKACGDTIVFRRIPAEERLIAVLADGLGHGIKAEILSRMTATMALKFSAADTEIVHSAEIIMDSLPVCQVRKISYSTFTIVDTRLGGLTRVVEMGNPSFLLVHDGRVVPDEGTKLASPKYEDRTMISHSFRAVPGDRVIFCSDGVTQAGLGSPYFPLGWGSDGLTEYVLARIAAAPDISAQELSELVLREAVAHEPGLQPKDDITAACLYFRRPRRMLLFTGPPIDPARDAECARHFQEFEGDKVVSGGTTCKIISRELHVPVTDDLESFHGDLPPKGIMQGATLVTEGILTLTRTAKYLENGVTGKIDPAGELAEILRRNDIIEFLVGTKINEAHQDPTLPADLELRRNIVKRIAEILREKYMKDVTINFV